MIGQLALGKYQLLSLLGSGSNAEVFLAEPVRYPGFRVVVKRIHDHVVAHPKFRQLFEAEVTSMANFAHPYAVRFLEASLDDPIGPCLVMEYVPGITLEEYLQELRVLEVEQVGRLLGYLCHALQAAHDAGIIHRDLKPANLMVVNAGTPEESIKVMDFGFAGFADKPHIQLAELTGHGPVHAMGTPGYVSPEMIRGDRVDTRSDLYAVGVILFEMLCGRLPFEQQDLNKLLGAHVNEAPPRFHKIGCGHVPPGVEAAVQLALSKYPNERQQSARELAEMFGHGLAENFWEQTAPHDWSPIPKPPSDVVKMLDGQRKRAVADPYRLSHQFEVMIPERLAAAKIRGFVEDVAGQVMTSEPGVIRMRVGVPRGFKASSAGGSAILGWIATLRRPTVSRGQEPIEVTLHLDKPDPNQALLCVIAEFAPLKEYLPREAEVWRTRCDKLHIMLRQYLGA